MNANVQDRILDIKEVKPGPANLDSTLSEISASDAAVPRRGVGGALRRCGMSRQNHTGTQRGWTSLMIKAHLGKADKQRSDPNGRLRKAVKLYRIERVHAAEACAAYSDLENRSEATAVENSPEHKE